MNGSVVDQIPVPEFYARFAGMLVLIILVLVLAAVAAVIAALGRFPAFSLPRLSFPADLTPEALEKQKERDQQLGGVRRLLLPGQTHDPDLGPAVPVGDYPTFEYRPSGRLRSVANARRVAGLAHRGEPLLRLLAILTAVALLVLGIPFLGQLLVSASWWQEVRALSGWALGLIALAAVAWVVSNALTSAERPLGLVWDIICFFPRAGHPFTAPCYAERAVPEVAKRVRHFIDEERAQGNEPYVILSAHSMGATIAVATLFTLLQDERGRTAASVVPGAVPTGDQTGSRIERVALLTHGVQLRAYFSRFFPEVLGARVLGVRGTFGPGMLRADPWKRQVVAEARSPRKAVGEADDPPTVVDMLGGDFRDADRWRVPRWRNLWRRTDYLGFPVLAHAGATVDGLDENPIDRGASERCPKSYLWRIARHNDYLSTAQYRAARQELVEMFREGAP